MKTSTLIYVIVLITLCARVVQGCSDMLGKCIDDDSCCERLGCYRGMCVPRLGGNVFVETQRVCGKMMDDCEGDRNCCDKLVCDFGKCMLKRRTFLSLFE